MSEPALTPALIRAALTTVKYPGFSRDIVSFGLVKNIAVSPEGAVTVDLLVESKNADVPRYIYENVMGVVKELPGVKKLDVNIEHHAPEQKKKPTGVNDDPADWKSSVPGVKHVIAVASGKGGVGNRARQAEASCNTGLMVGISTPEEKMALVRVAQQCSRLGRIVHQVLVMVQNVQEIAGEVLPEDVEAFKPIYLLAEVELRDAVLSILRGDEQLAYGVLRQDEELDSLYAAEMKRIFTKASSAMFYDFQVGTGLLFILRAIERIGDHAKQLAVPSFYRLTGAGSAAPAEKSRAL